MYRVKRLYVSLGGIHNNYSSRELWRSRLNIHHPFIILVYLYLTWNSLLLRVINQTHTFCKHLLDNFFVHNFAIKLHRNKNILNTYQIFTFTFIRPHLLHQTKRNQKIISKKKKEENRTGLKDLGRKTRRDEIKLIRIKLTRKSIDSVSILKSLPLDRKEEPLKLFNDSIPSWNYSRESSRDNLADWIFYRELLEGGVI